MPLVGVVVVVAVLVLAAAGTAVGEHDCADNPDARFLDWLQRGGGDASAVTFPSMCLGSRGMTARRLVSAGQAVLRVPQNMVLSPKRARDHPVVKHALGRMSEKENEGLRKNGYFELVLLLALEKQLGPQSEFAPYLSILPEEGDGFEVWTPHEIAELQDVRGDLGRTADGIRAFEKEMHAKFVQLLLPMDVALLDPNTVRWAMFVSRTRSVYIAELGGNCIVPLFDMANHRRREGGRLGVQAIENFVVVYAGSHGFRTGECITTVYTDQDNASLLKNYGIVEDEVSDKDEYALYDFTGRNLIAQLKYYAPPFDLLDVLRRLAAQADAARGGEPTYESEQVVLHFCRELISKELSSFPTTEEADANALEHQDVIPPRLRVAITFRLHRKRILKRNLQFCEEMTRELHAFASADSSASVELLLERVEKVVGKKVFR